MSWLQHEIVVFVWSNLFDEKPSYRFWTKTISKKLGQIGPPLTEIVVYINNRHSRRSRTCSQASNSRSNWQGLSEHLPAIRKLKVIDHIDQKENGGRWIPIAAFCHPSVPFLFAKAE